MNCHHNYTEFVEVCITCIDNQRNDSQLRERLLADSNVSIIRDFLGGCRPYFHSCGGLLLLGGDGVPKPSPLPDDALARRAISLVAQILAPESNDSHSQDVPRCACEFRLDTVFPSNSFVSRFGQDFCHPALTETSPDKLDRALRGIFFGEEPLVNCTSGHRKAQIWLTRKGAIDASEGKLGVIPGSMGTRSYVVRGKGSRTGLFSAPHGAGRRYSRNAAKKKFTLQDLEKAMEGIEYRRGEAWIDEIPSAYKDIDEVMEAATDLVEVVTTLTQKLNVKGT